MTKAAIVQTWGQAPTYSDIDIPAPTPTQVRIKIVSAGLHTIVRSRAAGAHFSVANKAPPHIPGVDGVGTTPSGELVYFNCLTAPTGSFAEEINVEKKDVFPLPTGADPDAIAGLANPTMSGWMALTSRAGIVPGQKELSVAIVGATGVSGHAAVQVARAMGASKIVAIGKPGAKLDATKDLGATDLIPLSDETDWTAAADVDVVLDYLYGTVAEKAVPGILWKRANKNKRLSWVHIGSLAGEEARISGTMLRKTNVVFMGCGPGSWSFGELYAQLPGMLEAMVKGDFKADFKVEKLSEIQSWWGEADGARRLVKPQ